MSMFQKVFGTHSEREVKRIKPLVDKIEALRPTMQALSDEDLRNKTTEFLVMCTSVWYNGLIQPGSRK